MRAHQCEACQRSSLMAMDNISDRLYADPTFLNSVSLAHHSSQIFLVVVAVRSVRFAYFPRPRVFT